MQMGHRKKQSSHEYNHTPTTLGVAAFGGACAIMAVESTFNDVMDMWEHQMNRIPAWQFHMGSVSVGIMTFFVFLFIMEFLETRSWLTAWRSSAPWLPIVGLSSLATVVHIPIYVVFLVGGSYAVWAYRRTCSVRRSP
jgi:hypothetical protein